MARKKSKEPPRFASAFKSFMGYLEGTEKAVHTMSSYRSDLNGFQKFLDKKLGSRPVQIGKLVLKDLERYGEYLHAQGLKSNSRRRKLITLRRFFRFLYQRNQVSTELSSRLATPHKIEKTPDVVPMGTLMSAIRSLPADAELSSRNRLLLWILAETGCLVSEVPRICIGDWTPGYLRIHGKNARTLPISQDLFEEVMRVSAGRSPDTLLFRGFNKHGPLSGAISPRGIELLVKALAPRLGLEGVTPRSFRRATVLHWYRQGISKDEIQKRLGLKTPYAFRVFEPLFEKVDSKGTTE